MFIDTINRAKKYEANVNIILKTKFCASTFQPQTLAYMQKIKDNENLWTIS